MDHTEHTVTATQVPDAYRLSFLPSHFQGLYPKVEAAIYHFARTLCPDYTGGYWIFHDLSNGGGYMAPTTSQLAVQSPNGHTCAVTGDAVGIIATLFALSHLSFEHQDSDMLSDRFHQLRDFAIDHAEADNILAAID